MSKIELSYMKTAKSTGIDRDYIPVLPSANYVVGAKL